MLAALRQYYTNVHEYVKISYRERDTNEMRYSRNGTLGFIL